MQRWDGLRGLSISRDKLYAELAATKRQTDINVRNFMKESLERGDAWRKQLVPCSHSWPPSNYGERLEPAHRPRVGWLHPGTYGCAAVMCYRMARRLGRQRPPTCCRWSTWPT